MELFKKTVNSVLGEPNKLPTPNFSTPERQVPQEDFVVRKVMNTLEGTIEKVPVNDNDIVNKAYADSIAGGAPEGTAVKSTGETGGTKYLREDGDGTCSWQLPSAGAETDPVFTAWEAGVGDIVTHDASEFAAALGLDDNYVTDAQVTIINNTSGTNSGDQTDISDFTGTKAEFDTACTDGNFAFSGGAFHDGFSDFVANEHIDWTQDQGEVNIHSGNYTNTTYTSSDFTHNSLSGLNDGTNYEHLTATQVSALHTQNTDTALGSGAVAADHGTAATDMIVNVCYGTGDPPTANTTTEGSLYIKYTA